MAGGAALAAKVAATLLTNEKTRKGIGWIIVAILSPLILVIVVICALLSGGAEHNKTAVDLSFNGGHISATTPVEYRQSIENMRESFSVIDSLVADVNAETEEISLDSLRVKAIFYALFYSETSPQTVSHSDFVSCFYYTEERTETETTTDEDGNEIITENTYTVNIVHSDLLVVYQNFSQIFGKEVTDKDMTNANEIYMRVKYGDVYELPSDVPFIGIDGFVEPIADWQSSVTSEFGMRYHPISGKYSMHGGIDLARPQGTQIFSVLDGTVTFAGYHNSYGYYIIVDHGGGFETLYAHCSKMLVSDGATVKAGDKIALMGSTGDSTGPHLHFETRVNGERVNPRSYLPIK